MSARLDTRGNARTRQRGRTLANMDTPTPHPTIGGEPHPLRPVISDTYFRLMDIISEAWKDIQEISSEGEAWRRSQAERDGLLVSVEDFDDKDAAEYLERQGLTREIVADAGGSLVLPNAPSDEAVFMFIMPRAYQKLRDPILTACAIVLADPDDLEQAEDAGTLDDLIAEWTRKIRRETTPEEFGDLMLAVFQHVSPHFFGEQSTLGKGQEAIAALISGAPEPEKATATKPRPKPKSSTRSRSTTAGPAGKS